uniref:Ig-like domain-containing protein n=1 Tax=Oryzias melastigma TaxID=30732 RepID=A0A3B3BRJ2_ORYME
MLPCSFQTGVEETVEWFKQDKLMYKFAQKTQQHFTHQQLAGRAYVSPQQVSQGNATLVLKMSSLRDRGTYRCHVNSSAGQHDATVILRVEAPIRGLFLELSRLSGFEEMKCIVQDVFPAPRVTWETEPPTLEAFKPVTRMTADKRGLYTVDSRLRRMEGQPDLIYICKMTPPYGGPAWTSSLREREIKGYEGKDLTLPCSAPTYLNKPSLQWSFSTSDESSQILTYNSRSGRSITSPSWGDQVELDIYKVPFGDGSVRLMNPKASQNAGGYTCQFSTPYSTHTERNKVTFSAGQGSPEKETSFWWIFGLLAGLLLLVLTGMFAYLKLRAKKQKTTNKSEEEAELNSVRASSAAAGQ